MLAQTDKPDKLQSVRALIYIAIEERGERICRFSHLWQSHVEVTTQRCQEAERSDQCKRLSGPQATIELISRAAPHRQPATSVLANES